MPVLIVDPAASSACLALLECRKPVSPASVPTNTLQSHTRTLTVGLALLNSALFRS